MKGIVFLQVPVFNRASDDIATKFVIFRQKLLYLIDKTVSALQTGRRFLRSILFGMRISAVDCLPAFLDRQVVK